MTDNPVDFQLQIEDHALTPHQIENIATMLRHELKQEWGNVVQKPAAANTKGLDPVAVGLLTVTILPIALTKFLEFLNAWAMRRENRHLKLKLQIAEGTSIELEVPQTSSPEEMERWIKLAHQSLMQQEPKGKKSRRSS